MTWCSVKEEHRDNFRPKVEGGGGGRCHYPVGSGKRDLAASASSMKREC